METTRPDDAYVFYQYLGSKIEQGIPLPSPEQLLDEWRQEHPASDDLAAINEALDSLEAGHEGNAARGVQTAGVGAVRPRRQRHMSLRSASQASNACKSRRASTCYWRFRFYSAC